MGKTKKKDLFQCFPYCVTQFVEKTVFTPSSGCHGNQFFHHNLVKHICSMKIYGC